MVVIGEDHAPRRAQLAQAFGVLVGPESRLDPRALREAILTFTEDPESVVRYAPGLSAYPVDAERFAALLQAPFVTRSRRASERMAT